ncbi:hypothetical protein [Sphingobacterium kitahiroshimense]|uniref:hypothetical protein n=1 Tax=Sphingobacterium kitahiroshimense TaxID=470446 RepID=UPI003209C6B5
MSNRNKHIESQSTSHLEMLPKNFVVRFEELTNEEYPQVKVTLNDQQAGDIIDDNAHQDDGYRYHDVFHYTFATLLDWSPCSRSMLRRKRKSCADTDRIEDGARATITEEAISLIIFSDAKLNNFYEGKLHIDDNILSIIKNMTVSLEVSSKSKTDWEKAILKSYEMFRVLRKNNGGVISFNTDQKIVTYNALN